MSLPADVASEIQKLAPSAIIELFELDATDFGGDVLRFHAGTNQLSTNVIWQGNEYTRYPIAVTGFEYSGHGQLPRPKMQVSNILSAVTAIILAHDDLLGAKITRKRTLAKFLDAVNFTDGNPSEDPDSHFEDDVYYIDRKSSEDRDSVEFELASAADLVNVKLPNRQIVQNVCVWKYRGAECGYTGGPVFDANDELIEATTPEGEAVIAAHLALVDAKTILDVKAATLHEKSVAKDRAGDLVRTERRYMRPGFGLEYYIELTPSGGGNHYRWASTDVVLGETYRRGSYVESVLGSRFYYIEKWEVDSVALAAATAEYDAALAEYTPALADYNDAQADLDAAVALLPPDDPLFRLERCGKRLSSCKVRFGENSELPFGAFPSVGLIR